MTDKLRNDDHDHSGSKSHREPRPVMGKSRLFVTEESMAHVANVHGSFDVDRRKKIRVIESQAPLDENPAPWIGTSSSGD